MTHIDTISHQFVSKKRNLAVSKQNKNSGEWIECYDVTFSQTQM